jgi:hypothetical protein
MQPTSEIIARLESLGAYIDYEKGVIVAVGLKGDKVDDESIRLLSRIDSLQVINLSNTRVTASGLKTLLITSSFRDQLASLTLEGPLSGGEEFTDCLSDLPKLTSIWFEDVPVTDKSMEQFSRCKSLEFLWLKNTKVTDEGVSKIGDLQHLSVLRLCGCPISDASLKTIGKMTHIRDLSLDSTHITDAGLVHLKECKKLVSLSLNDCKLDGSGLRHLLGLTKLVRLNARNSWINAAGLATMQEHPSVYDVHINGPYLSEEEFISFSAMLPRNRPKFLNELLQLGAKFSIDFEDKKPKNLSFDLTGTSFGDEHVGIFQSARDCPVKIILDGTKITPKGLAELGRLFAEKPPLRISLKGVPGIDAESIKSLELALPGCRVAY